MAKMMRTRWRLWAIAGVIAAGALAAGRWWQQGRAPLDLQIYFTADVHGRLVPCGCFSGQMGGLTRIATLLAEDTHDQMVKVDVGDAIEGPTDYQRIEYRYLLEAFARLDYDAANIGQLEAQLSAAQLREFKASSPVPLLSANLLDAATGAPIFAPYRIITRQGWRIALIGVLEVKGSAETLGPGLAVEKMETTLGKLLPLVRPQADAIVLLAGTDEAGLRALAREFYELDVILGGRVSQPSQQLEKENRSLILFTTNQSRALGLLGLHLAASGRITARAGEVMLVHDRLPESDAIRALAANYRDEVRRTRLDLDDPAQLHADMIPGVQATASSAGSESCLACHPSAAKAWQASGHARAFATLVARQADADPNCVACHTVGFGTPGGYLREYGAKRLTDVGCESCHGAGSTHVAQRQAGLAAPAKFHAVGAGDCQKCHHGEFSRPFDFAKFWPLISHGLEPTTGR